jgi:ketosteroid isomerase-like protein
MTYEREARAAVGSWNERGIDGFLEHVAPDVVWHAPPEYPEEGTWHGREALRAAWKEQFDSVFADTQIEVTEIESLPRGWYAATRASGRAPGSGISLDWPNFFVVTLNEERLATEVWVFTDRAPARRMAGLDPDDGEQPT